MADLYPTKTRIALLRAVNGAWVRDVVNNGVRHTIWRQPDGPDRKVCARIKELEAAGWVEITADDDWQITDAGWDVLCSPAANATTEVTR